MEKNGLSQKSGKKILSFCVLFVLLISQLQPLVWVYATVIDGPQNTLTWANNNFVNFSNSGAYPVNFIFSGTLDAADTVLLTATDGSGNTLTGSFVSASGGESSWSVLLNFVSGALQEWPLTYSGIVYSGSIASQVVASGMTLIGLLDITPPGALLSSTASGTITWAISVGITTSEDTADLILGDISVIGWVTSNFVSNSSTWYAITVTPSGSTGTMIVSVWTGVFSDAAGNPNSVSNTLSFTTASGITSTGGTSSGDTVAPLVAITSHVNNDIVTGFPTLSGTVSDTGWVASVIVNWLTATLGSGTWSSTVFDLTGGLNTVDVVATDLAGNTGSTSVILNRVSIPLNTNVVLSGTTSTIITYSTDISATGVLLFGTGVGLLDQSATGASPATSHRFILTGLLPDTIYYFSVQGQGGIVSQTMHFKTPKLVDTSSASGSIVATGSVYLSGSTATGIIFSQSGSLSILSLTASGSSLSVVLGGLTITASWASWDGVLQAPEVTSSVVPLSIPGLSVIGTAYQIGNVNTELSFSGQTVTISVNLPTALSGQTITVVRSIDGGLTYAEIDTCNITGLWDCIFTTNQLSLFAFAALGDVIPDSFIFSGVTNSELSTVYISNPVTISGIGGQTTISIVGGEYSVSSATFMTATGTTNSWDTIVVRATSSALNSTTTSAILTVGWVSAPFTLTTKAATGGGGGGGGGGWSVSLDFCPGWDLSPSYYDGRCTLLSGTGGNVVGVLTGSFNIPAIIITNPSDIAFRDVAWNWAETYINRLVVRGIIDNVAFYRPDASLTRAEFLKIVINSTGWPLPTTGLTIPFSDVATNIWYAPYVSLALSKGMIQSATRFRPNDTITRAEVTKILTLALGVTITEPTSMTYSDVSASLSLAKYIEAATFLNIFSGQVVAGRRIFRPSDPITRAEIAKVVVNTFKL